jgi:hypothetical protein
LLRLLSSVPGVAAALDLAKPLPAFDAYLPMMSAPHALGISSPDSLPARIPYVSAPEGQAKAWQTRLQGLPGLKVGLVWAGQPRPHERGAHLIDLRRSMRLEQFAPLAGARGASFISLQKGASAEQTGAPPPGLQLADWMGEMHDLADTAALVACLDLVISVDTSMVHLAGALGRPVWMLSRYDACWRWMAGRQDSPWYPALKIYRQPAPGDWASVMQAVARDLAWFTRA